MQDINAPLNKESSLTKEMPRGTNTEPVKNRNESIKPGGAGEVQRSQTKSERSSKKPDQTKSQNLSKIPTGEGGGERRVRERGKSSGRERRVRERGKSNVKTGKFWATLKKRNESPEP
jgi:hypothetical protein